MKKNVLMVLFRFGIALFGCAMFVSCASSFSASASMSTIRFTDEIISELGEENISKFQYYISEGILLSKVEAAGSKGISGGAAVISKSKARNEIEFLPSTTCEVIDHLIDSDGRRWLSVAFEDDNPDGTTPAILFVQHKGGEQDGQYSLMTYVDDINNYTNADRYLNYNGERYNLTFLDETYLVNMNRWPMLNIKLKTSDIETSKRRTVSGRQVK